MKEKSPYTYDVDEDGFAKKVIEASADKHILVDFWADWCSPCISLAPALEKVVSEYDGAVLLGKVEVDDNMRLAGHYRLRGFPTVIMFYKGEEQGRFSGSHPAHWIRDWIDEHASELIL